MKLHHIITLAAIGVAGLASFSSAAVPAPSKQLITAATSWVSSTTDNRGTTTNNYNGGDFMTVTPSDPYQSVAVTHVGFLDQGLNGLLASHSVAVWNETTGVKVLDVTVPAGTAADLSGGFRWVELPTPIVLASGTKFVLGGQTNGDEWKEAQVTGANTYEFPSTFNLPYGGPHYTPWHRWGGNPADMPTGSAGWGWNRHYIAGNLAFALVPEPTSIAAIASLGLIARRRRA